MTSLKYLIVILFAVMTSTCSDTRQGQLVKSLPDNQENRTAVAVIEQPIVLILSLRSVVRMSSGLQGLKGVTSWRL